MEEFVNSGTLLMLVIKERDRSITLIKMIIRELPFSFEGTSTDIHSESTT